MSSYGSSNGSSTGGPCPGYNTVNGGDTDVFYAPYDPSVTDPSTTPAEILQNGTSGCCHIYYFKGSVYAPSGEMYMNSNATAAIDGQGIVGYWYDKSGYHPDPWVSYNANNSPEQVPQYRLVQ